MPAYVIADVYEVRDQDALVEYRRRNTDAVANHGGRFVVRGGEVEALEGSWSHADGRDRVPGHRRGARLVGLGGVRAAQADAPGRSDTNIVLVQGCE